MGDFTYSGKPDCSILDQVRFLIQDTDEKDFLLSDSEINFLIKAHCTADQAALAACYILIAKFARSVDEFLGKQSIYASQMQKNYVTLARQLENRITIDHPIYFCNSSGSSKQFDDTNGDNKRAWRGDDN